MFPTEKVREILGITGQPRRVRDFLPCNLKPEQIEQLVACGAAKLNDRQNNAPKLGEFVKMLKEPNFPVDKTEFICYIVFPPRDDARVAIEGIEFKGITALQSSIFHDRFKGADELDVYFVSENVYNLRAWWD
jgi:hypothetical protein